MSSSTAHIISPTKTISSSQSATASPTQSAQPASQPSSNPKSGNGNNNGGLNTSATIALGVVIPAVSVIVAIIFGVRMWNSGFPRRKRRDSTATEVSMNRLGGNSSIPPTESNTSWNEMPTVISKPAELNEPWTSRTTTTYSEVPDHPAPFYSPITNGYANPPPDNHTAISPISSMNSHIPYNISQSYNPGHDRTPITNSQFPFSQPESTNWAGNRGGQPQMASVAELPTESRQATQNMPELSSHNHDR